MTVQVMGQPGCPSWGQWASPPTPVLPHFLIPPILTFNPHTFLHHTSPYIPSHKIHIPMLMIHIASIPSMLNHNLSTQGGQDRGRARSPAYCTHIGGYHINCLAWTHAGITGDMKTFCMGLMG